MTKKSKQKINKTTFINEFSYNKQKLKFNLQFSNLRCQCQYKKKIDSFSLKLAIYITV